MHSGISIEMDAPVTVALAPPEVREWGPYQFPRLARLPDGRIQLQFHIEADNATTYGLPAAFAVSEDEGRTWTLLQGTQPGGAESPSPLRLPNGDWLATKRFRSRPVAGLRLPAQPFTTYRRNGGQDVAVYRKEDLPEEYQIGPILARLPAGETVWRDEQTVVNMPGQVRTVTEGVMTFPVFHQMFLAPDGAVWVVNYGRRIIEGLYEPHSGMYVLRSIDAGRTWELHGAIPYQGDSAADPKAGEREGFTEPTVSFRPDGSVFCLLRTHDALGVGPLYWARSTDHGRTWSAPLVFESYGVWPQMLALGNGMTLAAYGRPGLFMRATSDPTGLRWDDKRVAVVPPAPHRNTCSYAALLALDDQTALIAYSDFDLPNEAGLPCKGIQVRRVRVGCF